MLVHALRHEGAFFRCDVGQFSFEVGASCAVTRGELLRLERVEERTGLNEALFLQALVDGLGERLLEDGAHTVYVVEFQDAQDQDVLMDGRLGVHIELELRDERCCREFRDRLVVGSTFDFRVLYLVRDRRRGAIGKDFGIVFFFGCGGRRRGDTLFDSDGRHKVANFVLLRHEPEGKPEVHDLPAELFQNLRANVVAVFDRVAETFRGAVVLDEREIAVRIVRVDNDGADGDASAGEAFLRLDVLAGERLEDLFAKRGTGGRCRFVGVVFLVLQMVDPFAEKGVLLVIAL